jgi:threonine/homoserine/homoserine lactone efflux protein
LRAWEAAAFQFVNPKAWVMAITIGAMFLPKSAQLATALPTIFALLVVVNFPCLCVWAGFGDGMGRLLDTQKWRLVFNVAMAVLLAGTAIAMVIPAR